MIIPEHVGGDRVQPHGLRHLDPAPPLGAGDAGIVDLSGADLECLVIEREGAFPDLELGGGKEGGKREDEGKKAIQHGGREVDSLVNGNSVFENVKPR